MGKNPEVTVDVVDGRSGGRDGPFVMYFPSGFNPVSEDNKGNLKVSAWRKAGSSASKSKKQHVTLVGEIENVDFVGENFGGGAQGERSSQNVVGVYNEEEGTLKLLPLGGDQVFRMVPRVVGDTALDAPAFTPASHQQGEEYSVQLGRAKALNSEFGRENIQRKQEAREAVRITAQGVTAPHHLQAGLASAAAGGHSGSEMWAAAAEQRNIPPHQGDAKDPREAYPLACLITAQEKGGLSGLIEKLSKAKRKGAAAMQELKDSGRIQSLVLQYLEEKEQVPDKEGLRCLAYLHVLLTIRKTGFSMGVKDLKAAGLTDDLHAPLLEKFAVERPADPQGAEAGGAGELQAQQEEKEKAKGFIRPHEKRDLLLCYILVFCLYCCGFNLELSHLTREFQLELKDLRVYLSELGCVISRTSSGTAGQKAQHRAKLLLADSKGKCLEELLPDRKPRPKAVKRS